jgi:hypothetical protein
VSAHEGSAAQERWERAAAAQVGDKLNAAEFDQRQAYRVMKACRDLLPRVLPVDWRCEDARENGAAYRCSRGLLVMAEVELVRGEMWLHVSLSRAAALPSWEDLREVKDLFVGRDRKAVQVLPPASEYVNIHPHCLHLYAPVEHDPLPDFRMRQPDGRPGI